MGGTLAGLIGAFAGKRVDWLGVRNIHARTTNRAIHPARMLHNRGDGPEFTHTLWALNINDMDQLEILIYRFEILIAYQRINLPDNSACINYCEKR